MKEKLLADAAADDDIIENKFSAKKVPDNSSKNLPQSYSNSSVIQAAPLPLQPPGGLQTPIAYFVPNFPEPFPCHFFPSFLPLQQYQCQQWPGSPNLQLPASPNLVVAGSPILQWISGGPNHQWAMGSNQLQGVSLSPYHLGRALPTYSSSREVVVTLTSLEGLVLSPAGSAWPHLSALNPGCYFPRGSVGIPHRKFMNLTGNLGKTTILGV